MSSIPPGRPPGRTHTQELRYSLRGTDARLESVLSTDKCLCDACCARFSTPNFVVLFSYFGLKIFFGQNRFFGQKTYVANFFAQRKKERRRKKFWCLQKAIEKKLTIVQTSQIEKPSSLASCSSKNLLQEEAWV